MTRAVSQSLVGTILIFIATGSAVIAAEAGTGRRPEKAPQSQTPPRFTENVADVWSNGRGLDAPRWPAARPLLKSDLSNADFPAGAWVWEGDILVGRGVEPWAGGKGNLWTRESYGNFVLSVDFRATEKANGGIFVRVGDVGNWLNTSTEIQILQGAEENARHQTGAIYDCAGPRRKVSVEANRWHTLVIMARGSRLTVFFDAELINEVNLDEWTQAGRNPDGSTNKYKLAPKERPHAGRIGLQYHGKRIEYRNLLIEELPD